MNREVKFRVWDRKRKVMIQLTDATIEINGEEIALFERVNSIPDNIQLFGYLRTLIARGIAKVEDLELMQSTGLLDKNGKEVFVGDVFFHDDVFESYRHRFVVEFGQCRDSENDMAHYICFYTRAIGGIWDGEKTPMTVEAISEQEVIGNIYENPELLDKARN